jgi:hypothetical protein
MTAIFKGEKEAIYYEKAYVLVYNMTSRPIVPMKFRIHLPLDNEASNSIKCMGFLN